MGDAISFQVSVKTPQYVTEPKEFGSYDQARAWAYEQMGRVHAYGSLDGASATLTMVDKNSRDQYRETTLMHFDGNFYLRRLAAMDQKPGRMVSP